MNLNIPGSSYLEAKKIDAFSPLPLGGDIDLTYRCNNNCRHCWIRLPPDSLERQEELTFQEIRRIADEARQMGCRRWSLSGGEPMLRPDFYEIFDYLTGNSNTYSLNTNGTLITHKIARIMRRRGAKMVALYGASADVHDHITRNPGSFAATMRGFRYLKEARARFTVQLTPMRGNYHQFTKMLELARSLSPDYRIGAAWFYLSACGDAEKNKEIMRQRLSPKEAVRLEAVGLYDEGYRKELTGPCAAAPSDKYLFASCIKSRREFDIDPYGRMTFCFLIKDPGLRYDLKGGSFQDCWDNFIPSLAAKIRTPEKYRNDCGSCSLKQDCRFCPVYGYLEHKDFNSKVEYLCSLARENRRFKEKWWKDHRRYFKIAGITIQVDSDLPFGADTLHPRFKYFEADGPGQDTIRIRHHFSLPDLQGRDLGRRVYYKVPWGIYQKEGFWVYLGILPRRAGNGVYKAAVFNSSHTQAIIYHNRKELFLKGGLQSLTLFPTDQILLARILADRQGCYLHACGVNFKGRGLLFAGHSGAGKSTIARLLKGKARILCDDRIIVRRYPAGFRIYGTWSHGDIADVSSGSAPLRAIILLKKASRNRITTFRDKQAISRRLLSYLIRPFVTADWWDKTLALIEEISAGVPCYVVEFDKSGKIVDLLKKLR